MISRKDLYKLVQHLLLSCLILLMSAQAVHAQLLPAPPDVTIFSPPQDVSQGTPAFGNVQMAPDSAGNINVVWSGYSPGDVFFSRSVNAGATFSAPQTLSSAPTTSPAQLAVDSGGNIYVAWFDYDTTAIYFVRSIDGGGTFSAPTSFSVAPGAPVLTLDPHGNIYLCWAGYIAPPSAERGIFFSRSIDGGATFSSPSLALNLGFERIQGSPLIAVDAAGAINIAWTTAVLIPNSDFAFYYLVSFTRSSDGGSTFSPAKQIADDRLRFPPTLSMAIDSSGSLNILWDSVRPYTNLAIFPPGIYLSRSVDGGSSFVRIRLSMTTGTDTANPKMALDSAGDVYVVWDSFTSANSDIFFRRSIGGGTIFLMPQEISGAPRAGGPNLAVDNSGNIDVAWQGGLYPNLDLVFSRSRDGGASFSAPQTLFNTPGITSTPLIAPDRQGNINVVWKHYDSNSAAYSILSSHGVVSSR